MKQNDRNKRYVYVYDPFAAKVTFVIMALFCLFLYFLDYILTTNQL